MNFGFSDWISGVFHQKGLIFLSLTSTISTYLPAKLAPHLQDIVFVIIATMLVIVLSLVELKTNTARTKSAKAKAKLLTMSKILVYMLVFFALKLFHLWILFDDHELIGTGINILIISIYALVALGEFKLIGNNLEKRYETKPRVFTHLDNTEKWILKNIVKKAERICNLEDDNKKVNTDDSD